MVQMKSLRLAILSVMLPVILLVMAMPASAQLIQRKKVCINGICYDVVNAPTQWTSPVRQVQQVQQVQQATVSASVDGIALRSDTVKFKRTLLLAARRARQSGDISMGQHLAIIFAAQRPAKLEELKNAVHELAIEDGLATVQAIDWDKFLAFLEKLIPMIITLIGLIGGGA